MTYQQREGGSVVEAQIQPYQNYLGHDGDVRMVTKVRMGPDGEFVVDWQGGGRSSRKDFAKWALVEHAPPRKAYDSEARAADVPVTRER
jgi:hypothetical protein